jgi:hypothetical protein
MLVLQSCGENFKGSKGGQIDAFAPLPTEKEIKAIREQCILDEDDRNKFMEVFCLVGPHLRECVETTPRALRPNYREGLAQMNMNFFKDHNNARIVCEKTIGVRRYFFLTSVRAQSPYRLWECMDHGIVFSCKLAFLAIYQKFAMQRQHEMGDLVTSMKSVFGHIRKKLGDVVEFTFGFVGEHYEINVEVRTVDFQGTNRLKRNYGAWTNFVLVKGSVTRDDFPYMIGADDPAYGKSVFFKCPRNTPLFDFALVNGTTINLIQVTVSDKHALAVSILDDRRLKAFTTTNFYMVRVTMCPSDVQKFKAGRGVAIPLSGNDSARNAVLDDLVRKKRLTNYCECIWSLDDGCRNWTDDDVKKVFGMADLYKVAIRADD